MDEKKLLNILYYLAGQGYGDNTVWEIIDKMEHQEEPVTVEISVKTPAEYRKDHQRCQEISDSIFDSMMKMRGIPQPKREEETTREICLLTDTECTKCKPGPCKARTEKNT